MFVGWKEAEQGRSRQAPGSSAAACRSPPSCPVSPELSAVASRPQSRGAGAGGPALLATGEHSCLRHPWVRDWPPGARQRAPERRAGRWHAGTGRWQAARALRARGRRTLVSPRAVSRVSYASRPPAWPLVAPRSLVLAACGVQSLTESRTVFTVCS